VFHRDLTSLLARVLQRLHSEHVLVVHGADGVDEISFAGDTYVAELKDGQVQEYVLNPQQFGLPLHDVQSIRVQNAEQSKHLLLAVLGGETGPARDIVLLNAGAAIYVAGLVENLTAGIACASRMIDSGDAKNKLQQLILLSQQMSQGTSD